jgi:hypothetical protein
MCVFLLDVFAAPQQETTLASPRRTSRKPLPGPAALGSLRSPSLRRPRKGRSGREEHNYRTNFTLAENFCKSPESTIVALDTFQGGIEHKNMELGGLQKQFEENVATVGSPAKVDVRVGFSLDQLCRLVAEDTPQFDFISVDASHQAADVLADAVLAFQLLKPGGVIAFDDYIWSPMRPGTENPLLLPKVAIDAFTTIYSQKLRILPNIPLYQLYIQKY